MKVAKITAEKGNEIRGKYYNEVAMFNPVQDAAGNWVISLVCAQYLDPSEYEIIDWQPPVTDEL